MSLPAFFALPRRSRTVTISVLRFVKLCAAVCGFTLFLAPPSHAGHWFIDLDDQPGTYTMSQASPGTPVDSYLQQVSCRFTDVDDDIVSWADAGNAERLTCHGTYNYIVTWIPDGPDDPPPHTVILKETAKAWWGAYLWPGILNLTRDVADDGWGDAPAFYNYYSADGFPNDGTSLIIADKASQSTRLVKYDGSSGVIYVKSPVLDVDIAEENSPTSDLVKLYAGGSFDVVEDHREAEIGSLSIEASYFKANDEHGGSPYQAENQRNLDRSITTDSVVFQQADQGGAGIVWKAYPSLFARPTGFQLPEYTWSFTGDGTLSDQGSGLAILSLNFPIDPTSKNLNKQSVVRVEVQDSDSAKATNTFTVRWHYPKEGAVLLASGIPFWQPAELKAHDVAFINGVAHGTFGYSTYADFAPAAADELFNVAANGAPGVWSPFVATVGIAVDQIRPTETNSGADFNDCWDEPLSTGLPTPRDHSLMHLYQMTPELMVQYQEQTWRYDQYDQHGFVGSATEGFNHFMGSVVTAGEFSLIKTQAPAGGD